MLTVYGSPMCPDCREAVTALQKRKIPYTYIDITGSMANMKAFLAIRDKDPLFDDVKAAGHIGIPLFVYDDGSLALEDPRLAPAESFCENC